MASIARPASGIRGAALAAAIGLWALGVVIESAPARAATPENSPEGVVVEFVTALDHLDLGRLMATLSEDSTMFFPHPDATYRLDGKAAIAEEMERRFAVGREWAERAGITEPPYLGVVASARDRRVQSLGENGAVVTWVVDRPGNFGRRSAAVRKEADGVWRLVNFHSSNLTRPSPEGE